MKYQLIFEDDVNYLVHGDFPEALIKTIIPPYKKVVANFLEKSGIDHRGSGSIFIASLDFSSNNNNTLCCFIENINDSDNIKFTMYEPTPVESDKPYVEVHDAVGYSEMTTYLLYLFGYSWKFIQDCQDDEKLPDFIHLALTDFRVFAFFEKRIGLFKIFFYNVIVGSDKFLKDYPEVKKKINDYDSASELIYDLLFEKLQELPSEGVVE